MNPGFAEVRLSELCKTPARVALLRTVLEHPTMSVSALAARNRVTRSMVSRYLSMLEAEGILVRDGRGYRLVESPSVVAIRRLLNILILTDAVPLPEWAWGIGVYGSLGRGTNKEGSDCDLWVAALEVPPAEEIGRLRMTIRNALHTEVHILLLTPERIQQMRENDPPFYESLVASTITIRGESFVHT